MIRKLLCQLWEPFAQRWYSCRDCLIFSILATSPSCDLELTLCAMERGNSRGCKSGVAQDGWKVLLCSMLGLKVAGVKKKKKVSWTFWQFTVWCIFMIQNYYSIGDCEKHLQKCFDTHKASLFIPQPQWIQAAQYYICFQIYSNFLIQIVIILKVIITSILSKTYSYIKMISTITAINKPPKFQYNKMLPKPIIYRCPTTLFQKISTNVIHAVKQNAYLFVHGGSILIKALFQF